MTNIIRNWWIWAVRGVFAIIFGAIAILFPALALQTLILVFGAYALVDGGFTIYHALTNRNDNWVWHLVEGIVSVLAGIAAFMLPILTGLTLLLVIAFWAIVTGVMQVVAAWRLRKEIENEFWLGLAGVSSIIFGTYILFDPLGGALATAWLIGIYSIAFGTMLIGLALRFRAMDANANEIDHHRDVSISDSA